MQEKETAMSNNEAQEVLDKILGDLNSDDTTKQLDAMHMLEHVNYSSPAIVKRLEELAVKAQGAVQKYALIALGLQTSQRVLSLRAAIPNEDRTLILREVAKWEEDGLIETHRAEEIRRRYNPDIHTSIAIKQPAPAKTIAEPISKVEPSEPSAPPALHPETPKPTVQPLPASMPSMSLTQVLLSETSARIYLYLGAFFVIAAAAILAALVESARLPVLLIATIIFAAGAVGFKKRLPQPSFAFAVIFSFLLLIDAGVIADLLSMPTRFNGLYWSAVFIMMAVIWAFDTWFYQSRIFSMTSFAGLTLGGIRLVTAFAGSLDWIIATAGISAFIGLLGVYSLKRWKGTTFALPLFISTQAAQGMTLIASGIAIIVNLFKSSITADIWIANILTCLVVVLYFAASDLIIPFVLFPWAAVASLFLIPFLFLSMFDAPAPAMIAGFGTWGALMAFSSAIAGRLKDDLAQKYQYPLLALSLSLFSVAILWGLAEGVTYAFAAFLATGIVYALVHASQPRWYVWTAALLAGLGAFLSFFALPPIKTMEIYIGYRLLLASMLLLLPELFFTGPLSIKRVWNWPPVALGIGVVGFNMLVAYVFLTEGALYFGYAAIIFGVYALLSTAYAYRFKSPTIGYLGTSSFALTVVYMLAFFELDVRLPVLTFLSAMYYLGGTVLRSMKQTKALGMVFSYSGLALGIFYSLVEFLTPAQYSSVENAFPIAIAATLFAAEAFARRNVWLAFPANGLYLTSYYTLLIRLNVDEPQYFTIGAALLGMLMHYLLDRAKSKEGAFLMGMASQLVLLGTTYIQMLSTWLLGFFLVLFVQSLVILAYGIVIRSRSLVLAPIGFVVLGTLTIIYSALKNLSLVVIIGTTGLILLALGIFAVLAREQITALAGRFRDWNA